MRYIAKVLRLGPGEEIELFDGRGHHAMATVTAVSKRDVRVQVGQVAQAPAPQPEVTVAAACPKGERGDWLVEKLAELGVRRVVWLQTERSVSHPSPSKQERQLRVMEAATRQCGGYWVPAVEGPLGLREVAERYPGGWVADPGGEPWPHCLQALPQRRTVVVGPEGGFTSSELETLNEDGYTKVRLSPLILRVETAALLGAALLMGA